MRLSLNDTGRPANLDFDEAIAAMVEAGMSGADIVLALQKTCEHAGLDYPSRTTIYRKILEVKARQ